MSQRLQVEFRVLKKFHPNPDSAYVCSLNLSSSWFESESSVKDRHKNRNLFTKTKDFRAESCYSLLREMRHYFVFNPISMAY